MIKECPIIINNDAVTVVRFGDTDIQFSPIMDDKRTVNVKFENGVYSIVDHAEEPKKETKHVEIKETKKTIKVK